MMRKVKKSGINEDIYKYFGNPVRKEFTVETIQNRMGMMMLNECLHCPAIEYSKTLPMAM